MSGYKHYLSFSMKTKHCLPILIFCLWANRLPAQSHYFRHYQVENGLSHNTVFCAIQDKEGFVWFGTKDGLNRFDGNSFKVFRNNPADSTSLGNNFVYSIYVDKQQRLWIGTARGLYEYIKEEESFRAVPGSQAGDLYDIREDNNNRLWFVMSGKLYYYDKKLRTTHLFQQAGNDIVSALYISAEGNIWYASYGAVNCLDPQKQTIQHYNVFNQSKYTTAQWIRRIAKGPGNTLLIGATDQGLKQFEIAKGTYTDILLQNADKTNIYVRDIIEINDSVYWIGTESGIFVYNYRQNRFDNLRKSYTNPYLLSDNAVYALYKDKEGGIWAGTYFGGANYFRRQYTSFEKYFPDNTSQTISGNAVREICEDGNGNLWIGTEDRGLNKLNKLTGHFTHFLPGAGDDDISYYNIHGLLYSDNYLWIGTFEHGIDIMDTRNDKVIKHFDNTTPGVHNNFFLSFCKTRKGQILAGNTLDLLQFHPANDSFSKVEEIPGYNFVYNIREDNDETIWVSTIGNGLYYYNPVTKQMGHFRYSSDQPENISSNMINSTFEDSRGYIWVATEGGGICRYDKKSKQFKRYTMADGLPANFVFKILEDNKGKLWITTTRGLVEMDPDTGHMNLYTVSNGILNDQFNYNSGYKDADGRMYFGSVKGMISFNPQTFTRNNYRPPIYITGVQVHNKEYIPKNKQGINQSVLATRKITLAYNQSSISIDFAALSFTAPEMLQYTYIMHGLQDGWTTINTNRKAYFTDLSPGTYVFMVKASGNNNDWSLTPAIITIEILPPWWQSHLAYLVYIATVMAITYWLAAYFYARAKERTRRRMEQLAHEKEKELYEAKIDFFTQVAHEIKTPLTLINAPLEKITEQAVLYPEIHKNLYTVQKNTKRLIDLSNQLLDFRLTESKGYSLHFSRLNITDLVREVFADFKPIAEKKKLTYNLNMTAHDIFAQADEDAMQKIFTNLFSNAIKYSEQEVDIHLNQSGGLFELRIFNDGFIIPADKSEKIFEPFFRLRETEKQKGTGIGLALSRSLTLLHKGTLSLENGHSGKGNTFVLRIPTETEKTHFTNPS